MPTTRRSNRRLIGDPGLPALATGNHATSRPNLLGQDVGMAGVPGDFGDHAYVDEAQAHGADNVVFDRIVQLVFSGDFARPPRRHVFSDHGREGFVVGEAKATVTVGGVTVAFVDAHARKCSLEPDAFGRSAMFDQRDGRAQRGNPSLACLDVGKAVDGSHELRPVQIQDVLQQLSFIANGRPGSSAAVMTNSSI
jgi:hypothetical protein